MKNFFFPIKIPQKQVWLLAASLSFGQMAFPIGNNVSGEASVASPIVQQNHKMVTGTVTDSYGPVIGASVIVKGTTNGVITDMDGNFKLEVPIGATIVISYVGYKDKEIKYNGESTLKIELNENVQELQEVQVIAYGATKKVTVTGAMSSITAKDVLKSPVSSIGNALAGKMPGLSAIQTSGQPGSDDPTVYVRGVGSLNESMSQPLFLVDGVERSFFQLDPNEVEDITVLKDASATAVFGVRGANGVILVTTKRGQEGKAKISFSTSFALQTPTRLPDFANSYEYATAYNNAQLHDGYTENELAFKPEAIEGFRTHSNPIAYPDMNWMDYLVRNTALQTQHNLTISGGSQKVRYFASLGVFTQDGLFNCYQKDYDDNYSYNRYNYRLNLDVDLTKTTQLRMNVGGRVNDKHTPGVDGESGLSNIETIFRGIYWAVPFSGSGIVDGKWVWADARNISNSFGDMRDAMYTYYGRGYDVTYGNTLNFDFLLEQKLDFITKGLKAHVKGAYNSSVSLTKKRRGKTPHYEPLIQPDGSILLRRIDEETALGYEEAIGRGKDWYMEAALNYKRDFGKHHVSGLVMYNQSITYYPSGPSEFLSIPRSYIGLVGRATYDYNTRYMFDVNVGYNGSENFAPGKRFGLFPAFSVGWVISEESFMQPVKSFMDYLKVRASYGIVGNDRVSDNSRFLYLPDVYNASNGGFYFGSGSSITIGANEAKKGNPNVTWETAAKQNYGVDAYFFNSKLKVNFDYFIEHRRDILTSRGTNPGYLAVTLPTANIGKVDNKGYEINVNWRDNINKLKYNIGFNISRTKNKIIYMDEVTYPYPYMQRTGKSVGQYFGRKFAGYFSEEDVARYTTEEHGGIPDHGITPKPGDVMYMDLNGDKKIDQNDITAIGNTNYPQLSYGINYGISYKGFDISMTWAGAAKTSRMLNDVFRYPFGQTNQRSLMKYFVTDTWTQKGDAAKYPAISFVNRSNNYYDSDLWLRDASYLRLKNVEVGYSFPRKTLDKMHLGSLRVYATGYNLLTFDKLDVIDPESKSATRANYPLVMVINFGLKVGF
ncbi:TonB-dependent receptor [uncultured Bacteroides sp.]|uniref:SusC/RagA family TonB-linked outer membrane protein n=1 Tax=uncultured Bacteroides sp. TaxID=162156 RepID=UPI00260FDBB6|nr:TonB-dependent receptor [uncultured Bacteroides sp.]